MELTEKQKRVIEKVGVGLERRGMRPAAARILGLLCVSDQTELTFEEIMEHLGLSRSATSYAISFLLECQKLDYVTHSGDRKRYFRVKFANWQEGILQEVENVTSFSKHLSEILEVRTTATPEFNSQIVEFSSFLEFLSSRLPQLMEEWIEGKKL